MSKTARARSATEVSVDEAHREGLTMTEERDPNAEVMQERVRIPFNAGQKLSLRGYKLEPDKFHYRWFHEDPTRPGIIPAALEAFYEHCTMNGQPIKAPSGAGADYLMRLPMEYHRDDLKAAKEKRAKLRQRDSKLADNEYTTDDKGRPVYEGEVRVNRKQSDNPYA